MDKFADETHAGRPVAANTHEEPLTDHLGNPIFAAPVNGDPFAIVVTGVPNQE